MPEYADFSNKDVLETAKALVLKIEDWHRPSKPAELREKFRKQQKPANGRKLSNNEEVWATHDAISASNISHYTQIAALLPHQVQCLMAEFDRRSWTEPQQRKVDAFKIKFSEALDLAA